MTFIYESEPCSKCGKTSWDNQGWIKLQEEEVGAPTIPPQEELGKYFLCPKCRADILGSLNKYVKEMQYVTKTIPGWTYKNADELTWETKYIEDVPSITISSNGDIKYDESNIIEANTYSAALKKILES